MSFLAPVEPLLRLYVAQNGKFLKPQVLYLPDGITPPNGGWVYRCESCRYWQKGQNVRAKGTCQLVSEKGLPDDGAIMAGAWCAVWNNRDDDLIFSWIARSINGEAAVWEADP